LFKYLNKSAKLITVQTPSGFKAAPALNFLFNIYVVVILVLVDVFLVVAVFLLVVVDVLLVVHDFLLGLVYVLLVLYKVLLVLVDVLLVSSAFTW